MRALQTYGHWASEMEEVVRPLVDGKVVWDLGAGSLGHSHRLLELGAEHVMAVDKEHMDDAWWKGRPITPVQSLLADLPIPKTIEVAFVAWPSNRVLPGLLDLLEVSDRVIYLGSNCNGDFCGWPGLWDYLHFREIEAHVPHYRNSLIVYGQHLKANERRPMVAEEVGATCGMVVGFGEAEKTAAEAARLVWGPNPQQTA